MQFLAYLGLRVGVGLVGLLPGRAVRVLGRWFGSIWGRIDSGRLNMARRHMRRVLGRADEVDQAAMEMMRSYGRYYAEALWIRERRVGQMLAATEIDGLQHLLDARDAGNGMVLALPHMGNWEAAAPIAVSNGIDVVAVAEVLGNRRITDWFTEMRGEVGIEIVLATGRLEVMRRLEEAVAENKAVALLADRDLKGRGVEIEFFGERTTMPPGPASLAVRTGAPLLPVGCYFTENGYKATIHPPMEIPDRGSKNETVEAVTQELARSLESIIREAPSQWHLVVPNWPSDEETRE